MEPAQPPTTTRNTAEVSPLSPSLDGVEKTARNSDPVTSRAEAKYVPDVGPADIVPAPTHAVVPVTRRWSVTLRPASGLLASRS